MTREDATKVLLSTPPNIIKVMFDVALDARQKYGVYLATNGDDGIDFPYFLYSIHKNGLYRGVDCDYMLEQNISLRNFIYAFICATIEGLLNNYHGNNSR